jgi:WD40 repeat protein
MTNPVNLRLAVTLLCICIIQSPHYSQTNEPVVKLRLSFELRNAAGVSFDPVSKLLEIRRKDGSVQIIDITDGREQTTLPLTKKEPFVMSVKTKHSFSSSEKKIVRVLDGTSGELKFEIQIKGLSGRAQFSPDGKRILTTSDSEDARLWDVETGRLLARLRPPERRYADGSSGVFRPDGKVVAVHSYGYGIYLWDCATGLLKTHVALDTSTLAGFSPDGKLLAIHRIHESIEIRDSETGALRSTLMRRISVLDMSRCCGVETAEL